MLEKFNKAISAYLIQDQGVALRVKCVAYPDSSKHYADVVVVSASTLTFSIDGTADSTVGTAGVITISSGVITLGALVDAINLSANWKAEIVAGLRADAVNGSQLLARTTSTFKMGISKDLYWDSSTHLSMEYVLEPGSFLTDEQRGGYRVGFKRFKGQCDVGSGTLTLYVYEIPADHNGTYAVIKGTWAMTDDTELDTGAQDVSRVQSDYGKLLLVRITGGTDFPDTDIRFQVEGEVEGKV